MKKLIIIGLIGAGLIAFIGTDVVGSAVSGARDSLRDKLKSETPLATQLAEAQQAVDAYAESIIRGEVAAENLKDMIIDVEREVRALAVRVEKGRETLVALRSELKSGDAADGALVPASVRPVNDGAQQRNAIRHVHAFRMASESLTRRERDLERLKQEYASTVQSIEKARVERVRLSDEVRTLTAELESVNARKAAARTRESVGDSSVAKSGFARAKDRLSRIKNAIREQNKLLEYYEVRGMESDVYTADSFEVLHPENADVAIEEALAAYPGN